MTATVIAPTSDVASLAPAWMILAGLGAWLAVSLLWMGLALGAVFRSVGARPRRAWVPVLRFVEMARATQSGAAGTAVTRVLAAGGLAAFALGIALPDAADVAAGGLAVAVVGGVAAWILWIVHARRLGLDYALAPALTVLAAVAPWLWAGVVGFGRAVTPRPQGPLPLTAGPPDAAVVPDAAVAPDAAGVPDATVVPDADVVPDVAEEEPRRGDAGDAAEPIEAIDALLEEDAAPYVPVAPPAEPAAETMPLPVRRLADAALASNGLTPVRQEPAAASAEPASSGESNAPTGPLSPYMRGGPAAPPSPPAPAPELDAPRPRATPPLPAPPAPSAVPEPPFALPTDDRTQVSSRSRAGWEIVTSEGRAYGFDSATVLLGRVGGMPPTDGTPRLDLHDSTRTVSKSHARLTRTGDGWSVEDLGSTNGTYVIDASGHETAVPEGEATPVVGRLALGDVEIEIRRREGRP